jgi:DNA-binding SARP family transcriptional activator
MIRTLGTFEVELHGQLVDPDAWSYTRPRELLVFLLLHPRGCTRDEIGNALWPESTPPQVKNSFHVTLHHLRKRLGDPGWVLVEGERYRLAPDRSLGWDGGRFREGIEEFLRKDPSADPEVERLGALLDLYRGDLLEGAAPSRWLEEARDRFRRLYVDGRMLLARKLEARGEFEAAAEEYREVLRREEFHEEAHRGLMVSWARSGHRDRAIRHFERLEALLREAIAAVPEPATMELYRRILTGQEPESVVA